MNNQNSEKENPSPIYFSPTGGDLPPIKEEDKWNIKHDAVNHPKHYTSHPSGVECIEITRHYCFSIGNAIKYLWRAGLKAEQGMEDKQKEIQDLEKAIWYINDRIKQLKKETPCK